MKTIGLIGGMSWESTAHYYEGLNHGIKARLGGLHSAPVWLHSVDFAPIEAMQRQGEWEKAGKELASIAARLEAAGAEGIVLCTNTMHKLAPFIEKAVTIPFLHLAKATAAAIKEATLDEVILLGTRFTMQEDFYTAILEQEGITVHVPHDKACQTINRIIFEELCLGQITQSSKETYLNIIHQIAKTHPSTQGVILGCTEIGMLLSQEDTALKTFDTTALHVNAILDFMLA